MRVDRNNNEVILRLNGDVDVSELQDLIDLFEFKEIATKSKASQKDVDKLVKTVKRGRWRRTKRILGE